MEEFFSENIVRYLRGGGNHRILYVANLSTSDKILYSVLTIICIMTASIACGLTQGLLSLNPLEMNVKIRSGSPEEKEQAARVLPLITNHHLLLVTLMLTNATANEALPLFLNELLPEYIVIILSVTCVLIFGKFL